jgi:hypothetical protein
VIRLAIALPQRGEAPQPVRDLEIRAFLTGAGPLLFTMTLPTERYAVQARIANPSHWIIFNDFNWLSKRSRRSRAWPALQYGSSRSEVNADARHDRARCLYNRDERLHSFHFNERMPCHE